MERWTQHFLDSGGFAFVTEISGISLSFLPTELTLPGETANSVLSQKAKTLEDWLKFLHKARVTQGSDHLGRNLWPTNFACLLCLRLNHAEVNSYTQIVHQRLQSSSIPLPSSGCDAWNNLQRIYNHYQKKQQKSTKVFVWPNISRQVMANSNKNITFSMFFYFFLGGNSDFSCTFMHEAGVWIRMGNAPNITAAQQKVAEVRWS